LRLCVTTSAPSRFLPCRRFSSTAKLASKQERAEHLVGVDPRAAWCPYADPDQITAADLTPESAFEPASGPEKLP
jgi:hypothetical protein